MQQRIDALEIGKEDHHYVYAKMYNKTGQKRPCSVSYVTQNEATGDAG
jgi:hypothetical protein